MLERRLAAQVRIGCQMLCKWLKPTRPVEGKPAPRCMARAPHLQVLLCLHAAWSTPAPGARVLVLTSS